MTHNAAIETARQFLQDLKEMDRRNLYAVRSGYAVGVWKSEAKGSWMFRRVDDSIRFEIRRWHRFENVKRYEFYTLPPDLEAEVGAFLDSL